MHGRSTAAWLAFLLSVCALARADDLPAGITGGIFALDLGGSSLKVAAPKFNTTIDIVLNEQSRRKTPNLVGFRKRSRYVGEEARGLAPRFPPLMVPAAHRLLGVDTETAAQAVSRAGAIGLKLQPNAKRGSVDVVFEAPAGTGHTPEDIGSGVSAEELTAMLVEYAAAISEADTGERPVAAAVAVPHATSLRQRVGLRTAFALAGVELLNITHSLTAAAFQYGVSVGGFGNATKYIIVVDVGATQAQAGLFRFEPALPKAPMSESLGRMSTVAVASSSYGGHDLDSCIAAVLDKRLVAEHGADASILAAQSANDRASLRDTQRMFALLRAAVSGKEALGINAAVDLTVEAATPAGDDFSTTLTRDDVDALCVAPHAERIAGLVARVQSSLASDFAQVSARRRAEEQVANASDAEAQGERSEDGADDSAAPAGTADEPEEPSVGVELVGAGSRVPAIAAKIADVVGEAVPIGRRLNTDDSVALGAAYIAARRSAFLRTRGFAITDSLPCAQSVALSIDDPAGVPKTAPGRTKLAPTRLTTKVPRRIFDDCGALPCRRSVAVRVVDSTSGIDAASIANVLSFTLSHPEGECGAGAGGVLRQTATVSGIEDAMAAALNGTALRPREVNVTVRAELSISTDGLLTASDALVRVSKPRKEKPTPVDVDAGAEGETGGDDESSDEKTAKKVKKAKKGKKKAKKSAGAEKDKRHSYTDLAFTGAPEGASTPATAVGNAAAAFFFTDKPRPMDAEEFAAAKASLSAISAAEAAARQAALRKNDLETLLLMERGEERHKQNAKAQAAFADVGRWLEDGPGAAEDTPASEFEAQHARLQEALEDSPAAGDL